jgi:hypothetical protein
MAKWRLVFVILTLVFSYLSAQNGGDAGFAVLKQPLTTWQMNLGENLSSGADAAWTNPAALMQYRGVTAQLNHSNWLAAVQANHIGVIIPLDNWAMAFQFHQSAVDDIEIRSSPTTLPGAYNSSYLMYGRFSLGYRFSQQWQFGLAAKIIAENLYSQWNQGYAFDFAGRYTFANLPLQLNLLLANIGGSGKVIDENTDLPMLVAAGAAYEVVEYNEYLCVTLVSEYRQGLSLRPRLSIGTELEFWQILQLQAAYLANVEYRSFSAGLHLNWQAFRIGIGWLPMQSGFADKTSFSLQVTL